MKDIEVYDSFNKNFDFNGDMTLRPTSFTYHVEINNIYEAELIHPYDSLGRWKYVKEGNVVKGILPNGEEGLFTILKPTKNKNNITAIVVPKAIYDLSKKVLPSNLKIVGKDGQEAADIILKGTEYVGVSNIKTRTNCTFFKNNISEAIGGEQDNTFLKRWGGEYLPINNTLYLYDKLGGDYGARIEYGFNLNDISLERDLSGVVTRIYPYVTVETTETIELPEKYIDSPLIRNYPDIKEQYIDFSEYMHLKNGEDDDTENSYETLEELYVAMRNKCKELYENGLDKPVVSGSVQVEALENTIEYDGFEDIVRTDLGDSIDIFHSDIGINSKERCKGFIWDIINEKYIEVMIGELNSNTIDMQFDTVGRLDNILNPNGTINTDKLQGVINSLNARFIAMRDIAQTQPIRAMIFEDKIKGSATYGAMCLGTMGFQIASRRTPDDKDWEWETFGTGQGFFAEWLVGKLKTVLIQNMDASFELDLTKSGGVIFRNNGQKAIEIANNKIGLFNYLKEDDYIGGLLSLINKNDPNKPLVCLANDNNSAMSLGYEISGSRKVPAYGEFDKYGILDNAYPITWWEETEFKKNIHLFGAFFGKHLLFDSSSGDMVIKLGETDKKFMVADSNSNVLFEIGDDEFTIFNSSGTPLIYKMKGESISVKGDLHVTGNVYASNITT